MSSPALQIVPSASSLEVYLGDPSAPGGGVFDNDTHSAITGATVTLAITESDGTPVTGLGSVAMPDVVGAAGDYRCVIPPTAGLVRGRRYRAAATIVYGSATLVVHAVFEPADYFGEAAA